jgi:hypothetical protein
MAYRLQVKALTLVEPDMAARCGENSVLRKHDLIEYANLRMT